MQKKKFGAKSLVRYEDVGWVLCKSMLWITKLWIMASSFRSFCDLLCYSTAWHLAWSRTKPIQTVR